MSDLVVGAVLVHQDLAVMADDSDPNAAVVEFVLNPAAATVVMQIVNDQAHFVVFAVASPAPQFSAWGAFPAELLGGAEHLHLPANRWHISLTGVKK
ncbi:hypothetical protein AB0H00_11620 [Nocardia sp. NPDC023852]|uniref:hypothetical protein n=1 Tax=Nocardia sp. NPDC023852 TaxID=3154697 RepID=UPI0033FA7C0B